MFLKMLRKLFGAESAEDAKARETELLRARLAQSLEAYEGDDTTLNEFNRIWNEGTANEHHLHDTRPVRKHKTTADLPDLDFDVIDFDSDDTIPDTIWEYIEEHRKGNNPHKR